jgi:hypothetical protein
LELFFSDCVCFDDGCDFLPFLGFNFTRLLVSVFSFDGTCKVFKRVPNKASWLAFKPKPFKSRDVGYGLGAAEGESGGPVL